MTDRLALLLVGSPRGAHSTSCSLGAYLLDILKDKGFGAKTLHILRSLRSGEVTEELLGVVDRADVVILSCPLYVDSTPAPVVRLMELVAQRRSDARPDHRPRLVVISNCGFPEAKHNETALAIYRRFAKEARLDWAGGLAIGMGGAIDGRTLDQAGTIARRIRRAMVQVAEALDEIREIPWDAVALAAKPPIPQSLYLFLGNRAWKKRAKDNGLRVADLDRAPYRD